MSLKPLSPLNERREKSKKYAFSLLAEQFKFLQNALFWKLLSIAGFILAMTLFFGSILEYWAASNSLGACLLLLLKCALKALLAIYSLFFLFPLIIGLAATIYSAGLQTDFIPRKYSMKDNLFGVYVGGIAFCVYLIPWLLIEFSIKFISEVIDF